MKNQQPTKLIFTGGILLMVLLTLVALFCGRITLTHSEFLTALVKPAANPALSNIIYTIRMPRVIGALLIGGGLATAGCAFQSIFYNPLVSPDILGVSYGAAVGAATAILIGGGIWLTQLLAFVGGLVAVSLTLLIARLLRQRGTLILVLAGIVVSGFMQALIGLLKYVADPDSQLQSIVYWQLGSLAKVDFSNIMAVLPMLVAGAGLLMFLRWHLTILSLGDLIASTQGINIRCERLLLIFAGTILTAGTVCLSGNIGWVGLVIPHMARALIGDDDRLALPLSAIFGAIFLLFVDTLARSLSAGEIPLSILTGFIGAPLFIYILLKKRVKL
ncbi:FecCD family ABC transporter permease [Limosilactobacillus panis]|uniref:Iron ABC transporter permease n=1 Tax=Limosilactobacillus panis TaxID=47493 RepID=A0ABT7VLP5_9LACO|nr:iron ABC transporter permease [Limosilactobacillus panis]MDM8333661.1 iron ABC transporter permease [Limosilactobacillus panis]